MRKFYLSCNIERSIDINVGQTLYSYYTVLPSQYKVHIFCVQGYMLDVLWGKKFTNSEF